jgi:hemoglobin
MMQNQKTKVSKTPFERIGGEARVQALTERFYQLMDEQSAYARLRAVHAPSLDHARERLFWFLCGWLGGPKYYTERVGHPMLRARHLPQAIRGHTIGIQERDEWVACMDQAMGETGVPEKLRVKLREAFFETADWMRTRAD